MRGPSCSRSSPRARSVSSSTSSASAAATAMRSRRWSARASARSRSCSSPRWRCARRSRSPRASLPAVAAVGLADVTANALFAFASRHGLLALVSVLGSLYPIVTVLLAHVVLGERLTRSQQLGIARRPRRRGRNRRRLDSVERSSHFHHPGLASETWLGASLEGRAVLPGCPCGTFVTLPSPWFGIETCLGADLAGGVTCARRATPSAPTRDVPSSSCAPGGAGRTGCS